MRVYTVQRDDGDIKSANLVAHHVYTRHTDGLAPDATEVFAEDEMRCP